MSWHPRGYRKSRGGDGLTDQERRLLHRLALGETRMEAADELGLSKQRVHQLLGGLERHGYVVRANGQVGVTAAGLRVGFSARF